MLCLIIVLGVCSTIVTLALCRAAGVADKWEEEINCQKNKYIEPRKSNTFCSRKNP